MIKGDHLIKLLSTPVPELNGKLRWSDKLVSGYTVLPQLRYAENVTFPAEKAKDHKYI